MAAFTAAPTWPASFMSALSTSTSSRSVRIWTSRRRRVRRAAGTAGSSLTLPVRGPAAVRDRDERASMRLNIASELILCGPTAAPATGYPAIDRGYGTNRASSFQAKRRPSRCQGQLGRSGSKLAAAVQRQRCFRPSAGTPAPILLAHPAHRRPTPSQIGTSTSRTHCRAITLAAGGSWLTAGACTRAAGNDDGGAHDVSGAWRVRRPAPMTPASQAQRRRRWRPAVEVAQRIGVQSSPVRAKARPCLTTIGRRNRAGSLDVVALTVAVGTGREVPTAMVGAGRRIWFGRAMKPVGRLARPCSALDQLRAARRQ